MPTVFFISCANRHISITSAGVSLASRRAAAAASRGINIINSISTDQQRAATAGITSRHQEETAAAAAPAIRGASKSKKLQSFCHKWQPPLVHTIQDPAIPEEEVGQDSSGLLRLCVFTRGGLETTQCTLH